jgi:hypothetical protein
VRKRVEGKYRRTWDRWDIWDSRRLVVGFEFLAALAFRPSLPDNPSTRSTPMRRSLAVGLVVLGIVPAVSGQSATSGPTHVVVSYDYSGAPTAFLEITESGFYLGEPSVGVRAEPAIGSASSPSASRFTVRAWREGDQTRIVVYAVVRSETARDVETPIATYDWPSVHPRVTALVVGETSQWGAAPIVLRPVRPVIR